MPSPLTAHTPTPLIPNFPGITDLPAKSGSWNGDNATESVSWDQDDNGWEQEEFTFPLSCSPSPFAPDDHSNENIQFFGLGDKFYWHYHPKQPCNEHGKFLENGVPPPAQVNNPWSWFPYDNQL